MQAGVWEGEFPARLCAALPSLKCRTYLTQNFIEVLLGDLVRLVSALKDEEHFDTLTDLTAVDHPSDPERFELVYILYSFERNERVRLKTRAPLNVSVPSVTPLYAAANWLEREVFDMFGIPFSGHPDLKRILMPEDWRGHPLRKDASITGMDNQWVKDNLGIESGQ